MAKRPVIDAHLHIWDPNPLDYPWHGDAPALDRPFSLGDFDQAIGDNEIKAMVFLEAGVRPDLAHDEAVWISELADGDPRIKAIVASAPLENGDKARAQVERLTELPLTRGIRRIYQDEPDLDFCLRPDFITGVRALAAYDLSFDICMNWRHMDNTIRFAGRCDNVPMILDHIGKPDIAGGGLDPWRRQMKELAALPHVTCKMSGVATEADHDNWTREELRPFILEAVEAFGFDRLMFGGDWPVASLAITYPEWIEVLEWALDGANEEELGKLFHDNAAAFYRLELEG